MPNNKIEASLLPCPFCGGKPEYEGGFPDTKLVCSKCDQVSIKTAWYGNDLGLVEACWNTRVPFKELTATQQALDSSCQTNQVLVKRLNSAAQALNEIVREYKHAKVYPCESNFEAAAYQGFSIAKAALIRIKE
ncbi:hypothetical protein UFOVP1454_17 [uncultured Caudovirales phage]|uniref:Restriction alleviation protein Lar n=1 Tax=uncultured Caudovirales phage TaxID=2100421 RepID=A0A6J5SI66_9CAUD|nr:hypothetical protein UFOVP1454_17 [uncultured Caudovirales phage]